MNLSISGIHMETSPALQEHAENRLQGIKKYFDQVIDVNANFVQEPHHHHMHAVELAVLASGTQLHAEGIGPDWYVALDDATTKLERQLERYKGRLQKQRERRKSAEQMKARTYDGVAFETATLSENELDDLSVALDGVDRQVLNSFAPAVVRKDVSKVAPMTVDEAIMQMDLLHKPAFLFLNAQSGKLNMVYREGEKDVRWVAPAV